MRSAPFQVLTARRLLLALGLLLGGLGFAGKADAQALQPYPVNNPPIQLRYPPPCGYSWVAHPNPYCSYGIAGPTDRPGQPVQGVGLPPFIPGMPYCHPNCCQRCCQKLQNCCGQWCRGPMSPYGYAPGTMVRSPRDFFMQPGD